jgi:hypothetical protein
MSDEFNFEILNYTHRQLRDLLKKLEDNKLLTPEQYEQLIVDIGLNNISTFTGDYDDLFNKPFIPIRTSELINDTLFTNEKYVDFKIQNSIEALDKDIKDMQIVVDSLDKLELQAISDDIANVQKNINYLEEIVINLRNLYSSVETNFDVFDARIDSMESDINLVKYDQTDLRADLTLLDNNVSIMSETKEKLMEVIHYLKERLVGELEYEYEKPIVTIIKEIWEAIGSLYGDHDVIMGLGDSIDEEKFGVLMRKNADGDPELIPVRDYIRKIDLLFEQLGREGLIEFIHEFKDRLETLEASNTTVLERLDFIEQTLDDIVDKYYKDVEILLNKIENQSAIIKELQDFMQRNENTFNELQNLKNKQNELFDYIERTYTSLTSLVDHHDKDIAALNKRLQKLEEEPEHIYVTENELYRNYTEEERESEDTLFIVTDFSDQDLDWNIERFLTKDLVVNNSVTKYLTQAEFDKLPSGEKLNNNIIYVITDAPNDPGATYTSIDTSSIQLTMKNSLEDTSNTSIFVDVDNKLKFKDCDGKIYVISVTFEK